MEHPTTPTSNLQKLRERIFSDPPTHEVRDELIAYVLLLVDKAKQLPEDQLLGGDGHVIAMDICGALAWNAVDEDGANGWLSEKTDPILDAALLYASPLDADSNNKESWTKLFTVTDRLSR